MPTTMSRTDSACASVPEALTLQSWRQTQLAHAGMSLAALRIAADDTRVSRYAECCLAVTSAALLLATAVHMRIYQPRSRTAKRTRPVFVGLAVLAALFVFPQTSDAPAAPGAAPSSHGLSLMPRQAPTHGRTDTEDSPTPGARRSTRRRGHRQRRHRKTMTPMRTTTNSPPTPSTAYPTPRGNRASRPMARSHAHSRHRASTTMPEAPTRHPSATHRASHAADGMLAYRTARPTRSNPHAVLDHARNVRSLASRAGRETPKTAGKPVLERVGICRRTTTSSHKPVNTTHCRNEPILGGRRRAAAEAHRAASGGVQGRFGAAVRLPIDLRSGLSQSPGTPRRTPPGGRQRHSSNHAGHPAPPEFNGTRMLPHLVAASARSGRRGLGARNAPPACCATFPTGTAP